MNSRWKPITCIVLILAFVNALLAPIIPFHKGMVIGLKEEHNERIGVENFGN